MKKSIIKFIHKCTTKVAALCTLLSFPPALTTVPIAKSIADPMLSKSIYILASIYMIVLFIPILANIIDMFIPLEAPAKIVSNNNSNNDAIQHNENIKSLPKPAPMAKIDLKENFHKF